MRESIEVIAMSKTVNRLLSLILFLVLFNLFLTKSFLVCLPGDVISLGRNDTEGFYLSTAAVGAANLWRALYAIFAPEADLIYNPTGYLEQIGDFNESQNIAYAVVNRYLKNDTDEQQLAVPEAVQGNSGGLLLALAFYEQMTGQNIARGLRISGSGTLTNEGFVQPVLGIKQKILAANQHQIDVFFVHPDNLAQAKSIETEMLVVSVTSFSEALSFLLDTNRQSLYNL